MLNIIYCYRDRFPDKWLELIRDPDGWFKYFYEPEWFRDPIVKQIVMDIDKTEVLGDHVALSPVLGSISVTAISGGAKILIGLLKTDNMFDVTGCGENCAEWLLKIGNMKDITAPLDYFMPLVPDSGFNVMLDGDKNKIAHDNKELISYYYEVFEW